MSTKIQLLDQKTIGQIAAGEVIERPASVVKEFLENSLDAGATQIIIRIESGGLNLIEIQDNGHGIPKSELELAITRHATSKIHSFEDIFETASFGFRGEALASVAEVSEFCLASKPIDSDESSQIKVSHGERIGVEAANLQSGTLVSVRDLFAQIPVRRKYMKSARYEASQVLAMVLPMALFNLDVDISLYSDKKLLLSSVGITDIEPLLLEYLDSKLSGKMIPVDDVVNGLRVKGWVSDPSIHFANRNKQFLAINQRFIKNALLQRAITQVYQDLIPPGRFASVVLSISVPSTDVDVNIHPRKMDVAFSDSQFLFSTLHRVLKPLFQRRPVPDHLVSASRPTFEINQDHQSNQIETPSFQNTAYQDRSINTNQASPSVESMINQRPKMQFHLSEIPSKETEPKEAPKPVNQSMDLQSLDLESVSFLQVFDAFLAVKYQDHFYLIDQHALHERILFEQFKNSDLNRSDIQPLLIPETVTLSAAETVLLTDLIPSLRDLGIQIDVSSNHIASITAIPVQLMRCKVSSWLELLLADCLDAGSAVSILQDIPALQMKACKAAIKAGQRLEESEVRALLQQYFQSPSNYTCPHGRPLALRYDRIELDKLFDRR